jgi:hypothetical protein
LLLASLEVDSFMHGLEAAVIVGGPVLAVVIGVNIIKRFTS